MEQVDRLVESQFFRNSRRYPDFIRHIVQKTLDGQPEDLKERTLGIDIFGREPSYDTANDSIVRVAAAEVRKRIAQYYQEAGHEHELRIELPSGSYVPHFRLPEPLSADAHHSARVLEVFEGKLTESMFKSTEMEAQSKQGLVDFPPEIKPIKQPEARFRWLVMSVLLAVTALAGFVAAKLIKPSDNWLFGSVLAGSQERVLICVGSPILIQNQPAPPNGRTIAELGSPTANNTLVPLSDAITISIVSTLLHDHGRESEVQLARNISFSDLRLKPTVLVGALDNPWTMRLASGLPYRFVGTDDERGTIVDHRKQDKMVGQVDFSVPYSDRTQDYAIIALVEDNILGRPVLILAGIGPNGTMAAAEFVGDKKRLAAILKTAPSHWSGRNVEIILATQVIQGNSGPPNIVTAQFW